MQAKFFVTIPVELMNINVYDKSSTMPLLSEQKLSDYNSDVVARP